MYIIYCEHIFVYIFPCYFKGDSSFVTEVFHKKKKKKKIISPANWGTLLQLCQWEAQWTKRDFSYWFALKKISGRAGTQLWCSNAWHATLTNSPASLKHRTMPDPGWLPFKMAQKADKSNSHGQNVPAGGWSSFPSLETGPAQSRIRDWESVAASANWEEDDDVKSVVTSCCRKPESKLTALSFLTRPHWLRVCSREADYF